MNAQNIGNVRSGSGKFYQVKWDSLSKDIYVSYSGWTKVGKANSSSEAMDTAEAYLHDK